MTPSASSQLSASHISKSHGGQIVLDDVSLRVLPGARIGLLGPNGVGKSTLLRILAGMEAPDAGDVLRLPASIAVGLLDQEPAGPRGEDLRTFFARRTGVAEAADALEHAASAMTDELGTIETYTTALEQFDRLGGHDVDARAAQVAAELGFERLDAQMAELSGGERTRAALAAIELSRFDVVMLDEPTNNLDNEALGRLQDFVQTFRGGIVLVSHDRAFLDSTVDRFVELDPFTHRSSEFVGTWSDYTAARDLQRRHAKEAHESALAERARLQRRAAEIRQQATTAAGRAKRSDEPDKFIRAAKVAGAQRHGSAAAKLARKIDRIEVPEAPRERWALQLDLTPTSRGGEVVIRLVAAVIRAGNFRLGPVDLEIVRGERVALLGPNGSGKTTLLRAMAGEWALAAGHRSLGPSVVPGILDQDRAAFLDGENLLSMMGRTTRLRGAAARSILAKFELGADDVTRRVEELSPGERTRATLAVLAARQTNLLLLDEPTNHLDLDAIEELEQALADYTGTFVIATHDRRLLTSIGISRVIEPTSWSG